MSEMVGTLESEAKEVAATCGDEKLIADVNGFIALRNTIDGWRERQEANVTSEMRKQWSELAAAVRKVVGELEEQYTRHYAWIKQRGLDAANRTATADPSSQSDKLEQTTDKLTALAALAALQRMDNDVLPRIKKIRRALLLIRSRRLAADFIGLLARALWFVILSALLLWLHHPFQGWATRGSEAASQLHVSLPSFVVLLAIVMTCEAIRQWLLDPFIEHWWTNRSRSRTIEETKRLLDLAASARMEIARTNCTDLLVMSAEAARKNESRQ